MFGGAPENALREGVGMSNSAYERVKLARDSKRPTGLDYIKCIFNRFIELHGDRRYADDPAVVGGIARLNDTPVTVIAIEKGHTAKERHTCHGDRDRERAYRKRAHVPKFRYAAAGRLP